MSGVRRAEVTLLPAYAAVTAGSTALAWAVVGPSAWGHHSSVGFVVSNAVGIVLFTSVWWLVSRPVTPLPRTIPWTRLALASLFAPLVFLFAGYLGGLSIAVDQFVGMALIRARPRNRELIDL